MANDWLDCLDVNELVAEAPPLVAEGLTEKEVASFLYKGGPFPPTNAMGPKDPLGFITDNRPPREYWGQVRREIFLLICTDEPKYENLRQQLNCLAGESKVPLTGVIAGFVGNKLGLAPGVISGFCAVALYGAVKIGKEAWCSQNRARYDEPSEDEGERAPG